MRMSKSVKPSFNLSPLELFYRSSILESYFRPALSTYKAIEQKDPPEMQRNARFEMEDLFIHAKVCVQEQLGPGANNIGIIESINGLVTNV